MNKNCILFFLILPVIARGQQPDYDTDRRFTVAFYNLEYLFDTYNDPNTYDDAYTPSGDKKWTPGRYREKIDHTGKVFTSLDPCENPEIIGLAEVENRQVLLDLIRSERFSDTYYKMVHEDSPDPRGIDVTMLYRPDEFEYIKHQPIPILFPFDRESSVRDILYVKGIASGKDTLHVFINHWKSRAGGREATRQKRVYSARVLKRYTDSILDHNTNARIVITRDFNDEPHYKSLSQVLEAGCPQDDESGSDLHNLMCKKYRQGRGTYYYRSEWYMLDNFIVSFPLLRERGFTITEEGVKIFNPPWVLYVRPNGTKVPDRTYGGNDYFRCYSDHLAIYGTFGYVSKN
ncbi:MAG: endonuclease [Bacteroidota bacterium]